MKLALHIALRDFFERNVNVKEFDFLNLHHAVSLVCE